MRSYLSIVVPLYKEEESVELLVLQLVVVVDKLDFSKEINLIDDGSTDETWPKIEALKTERPNLVGLRFRRNYGQTSKMVAGLDQAVGNIIVTMNGDLQNTTVVGFMAWLSEARSGHLNNRIKCWVL